MAQPVIPALTLVDDVGDAFARVVAAAVETTPDGEALRFACSGGSTGRLLMERLAATPLAWSKVDLYFADERCVPPESPEANERVVREALGPHVAELAGFHPLRCAEGLAVHEAALAAAGRLDLLQLGVGPDGHTASLFPGSPALEAPPGRLVVENEDPSGRNPHGRCTLTFEAIAGTRLLLVVLTGADKRGVLERLQAGEDLPAARLRAERIVWLVDAAAAGALPARSASTEELDELGRRRR